MKVSFQLISASSLIFTLSLLAACGGSSSSAGNPDLDNDGYSNEQEISAGSNPEDANSTPVDRDGDGVENTIDAFPDDETETLDTDGDGVGNNTDTDDDDDGVLDAADIDADGDGLIEVSSLEQLDWIRNSLDGSSRDDGTTETTEGCDGCNGYELTADLDFDTNQDGVMNSNDGYFDHDGDGSNQGWLPLGDAESNYFRANFDGNGFTIYNLFINRPLTSYNALFGYVFYDAQTQVVIKNLNIEGDLSSVTGDRRTALLAASINNALIENCHVSGTVNSTLSPAAGLVANAVNGSEIRTSSSSGQASSSGDLGGLVGYGENDVSIKDSSSSVNLTATSNYAGGLLGYGREGITIERSYATGSVTGIDNANQHYGFGGLVGVLESPVTSPATVTESYATGAISGQHDLGGLIGDIQGQGIVTDSYATGNVTGTGDNVGGLIGDAGETHISDSYATGNVSGVGDNVGGLIGNVGDSTIINSNSTGNVSTVGN